MLSKQKSAKEKKKLLSTLKMNGIRIASKLKKSVNKNELKTAKSKITALGLKKKSHNPIISPTHDNGWEGWQTFNPGVIHLNNQVHFLYRAIGGDRISRLGYARSNNGYSIDLRHPQPAYEHPVGQKTFNICSYISGGSWGGAEDARIVRVNNEGVLYMTYTACNGDLRIGLTSINIEDFLNQNWNWKEPVIISPPNQLHKNWLLFPEKINNKYAFLLSIVPEIEIAYLDNLDLDNNKFINSSRGFGPLKSNSNKRCWDKWIRGAGPVPIKTKYGWLVFYHAMDNDWSKYKVGVMLLDINEPTKILARAKTPVLEPSEHYENHGFKGGVVYASGAIVKDDDLLVYYGGADSYVCLAYANFDQFVETLRKNKEPKLSSGKIRI